MSVDTSYLQQYHMIIPWTYLKDMHGRVKTPPHKSALLLLNARNVETRDQTQWITSKI